MKSDDTSAISVVLCACNGEKFLAAQLASIAAQTRKPRQIVICDDASEDRTADIIRAFARTSDIPVDWQINPTRLGVTKNFQKAIELAGGEIIFLCDQDDVWHTDKIAKILPYFSDAALVFSNGRVVSEDLSPAGYTLWDSMWFDAAEQQRMRDGQALAVLLRHSVAAGATVAFRSSYRPLLLPIPDLPHCHDIWITLLLACAAKIYPLSENLIDYRLHASNQVGLKKHGLLGQIRMARWQVRFGAFRYAADLLQAALSRLQDHGISSEPMCSLLTEKIQHSRARDGISGNPIRRLRAILSEWRRGRYARYSYGYKSILQDLFLR